MTENFIQMPRKRVGDRATISFPPGSDTILVQGTVTKVHSNGEVELNQKHPFQPGKYARGMPN